MTRYWNVLSVPFAASHESLFSDHLREKPTLKFSASETEKCPKGSLSASKLKEIFDQQQSRRLYLLTSASGTGCVKTISEISKWKLRATLWLLSLVLWSIQININSIINQLWKINFLPRHFLKFSHSLGTKQPLKNFGWAAKNDPRLT